MCLTKRVLFFLCFTFFFFFFFLFSVLCFFFCSARCQSSHWGTHRSKCNKTKEVATKSVSNMNFVITTTLPGANSQNSQQHIVPSGKAIPGLLEVLNLVAKGGKVNPVTLGEQAMVTKEALVWSLRSCTLKDVVNARNSLTLIPDGSPLPMTVLELVLPHLSLRDIGRASRVSKVWRQTIDKADAFWKGKIWWEPHIWALLSNLQEDFLGQANFLNWTSVLEKYDTMTQRERVQSMLSIPCCCAGCGSPLQGRHLTRAAKAVTSLVGVPDVAHLKRACFDCLNEFVITLQVARTSFPEIVRQDYVKMHGFRLDNRKCFLLHELREVCHRKRAEELEARAAKEGITARQLWEREHLPVLNFPSEGSYMDDDDDDENSDGDSGNVEETGRKRGREDHSAPEKRDSGGVTTQNEQVDPNAVWVPNYLVFEQPGEVWSPESLEVCTRRNFELLVQLQLIRVAGRREDSVGFVDCSSEPFDPQREFSGILEGTMGGGEEKVATKKRSRRKKGDDEEEYEDVRTKSRGGVDSDDEDEYDTGDHSNEDGDGKRTVANKRWVKNDQNKQRLFRPAAPESYKAMVEDPDLHAFLSRFGMEKKKRSGMHASFRIARAVFDSPPSDNDDYLVFKEGDELAVVHWMADKGWSVCYALKDPFCYTSMRRKYGFVPNNFVEIIDHWTREEIVAATPNGNGASMPVTK